MWEVILDTLLDGTKLLPFLFVTFLIIEIFEHKFSDKGKKIVEKSGKFGPVLGSIFGIVPQCGFSVAATNLYVTRIISLGTLFSVYLATSDEMIPILIAEQASLSLILKILVIKLVLGIIFGFLIDLLIRNRQKPNYDICDHENCECKEHIVLASLKHTFNIFIFILICTFVINLIMHFLGESYLESILLKNNIFAPFITSLIGLIPNCASSVVLTELYLNSAISFSSLIGGLLTGSGIALLVLLKETDKKEALKIIGLLYLIGSISGIIIEIVSRLI